MKTFKTLHSDSEDNLIVPLNRGPQANARGNISIGRVSGFISAQIHSNIFFASSYTPPVLGPGFAVAGGVGLVCCLLVTGIVYIAYRIQARLITNRKSRLQTEVDIKTGRHQILHSQVQDLLLLKGQLEKIHEQELVLRQQAEEANLAKSAFLAAKSHQIRTYLNGVTAMASLLFQTPMSREQTEYVQAIISSGDNLLALINDISDFSKIESGNMQLEYVRFDIRDCIEGVLDVFSVKAAATGLDLLYQISPRVPYQIIGDMHRLRQILINLVGNALNCTEKGQVLINVKLAKIDDVAVELYFEIRDTGIGIPVDKQQRLFVAFSQVKASHARTYIGTGLGLVISQQLVHLMGGTIGVDSVLGQGSCFYFNISSQYVTEKPLLPADKNLSKSKGKAILVVDDNVTYLRILTRQLRQLGMMPMAAETGKRALELVNNGTKFDLVITDQHMPETGGINLAARLKEKYPMIPIVLLSSVGDQIHKDHSNLFSAVLTKPLKHHDLEEMLEMQVNRQWMGSAYPPIRENNLLSFDFARQFPLTIIMAEDDQINQMILIWILDKLGYNPQVTHNGKEVLAKAKTERYDVVFMDLQMPEMDGLEATHRIRKESMIQPYIIAVTAHATHQDREACARAGMDDFISKPFKQQDIKLGLQKAYSFLKSSASGSHIEFV